jgi:diguanylate cyclase (GGDEF)-like protein/PAS domain S-box-containing protein
MSVRRRLLVAFLLLLSLFALNVAIDDWSRRRRAESFESLRQGLARQVVLASLRQKVGDLQKEMALLSEVYADASGGGTSAEEMARFQAAVEEVDRELSRLEELADPAAPAVKHLAAAGRDLAWSWTLAFQSFGVDNARSIALLSRAADPLSRRVLQQLLPQVEREEAARVEKARQSFKRVDELTNRVTAVIVLLSALAGAFVAVNLSRQVVTQSRLLEGRVAERTRELETLLLRLRRSEDRYALAARGANDGLWDWDLREKKVFFSPRWKAMLGHEDGIRDDPSEWFSRVHGDDREGLRMEIVAHLEGLTPHFEHEHRVQHRDGGYRWVLARGVAVRDQDGMAIRMAGSLTDVTQRKLAEEQLQHEAFHDALTGLPNRALFMDRLAQALARARARAQRGAHPHFAVLFLDVDRFKVVNDGLGHMVGDQLLIGIARRLQSCLRPGDTVARLGGDEFTVLVEDIPDVQEARTVAQRVLESFAQPFNLGSQEVFTTASMGIANGNPCYERAEDLLRDADTAMYRAKSSGRARHEVFDEGMRARAVAVLEVETSLRRALERDEMRVHYQPIVSLATGEVTGVEALVRWHHPEKGLMSTKDFIAVAEETGLIVPLGRWVMRQACRDVRTWDLGLPQPRSLTVSVNVSGRQFVQPDLAAEIKSALEESGLAASRLCLEITESVIMENTAAARETFARLRGLDIQIHMDDFGTGYSSMSSLRDFQIDALKIDQSFVSHMGPGGQGSEIVRTIVDLGHSLGMSVVAEGIETLDHVNHLKAIGCEFGQGYYFSKPVDVEAARGLLAEQTPPWRAG